MTERGFVSTLVFESTGEYGAPKVAQASGIDGTTVRVFFDQDMKRSNPIGANDATNPSNYTFSGDGVPVTAVSCAIVQNFPTYIDVTLNREMTGNSNMSVEVNANVESSRNVPMSSDRSAAFSGFGERPSVDAATAVDGVIIEVTFNEAMNTTDLAQESNYDIDESLGAGVATEVDSIDVISDRSVWIWLTVPMTIGETYRVTVSNVRDLANNEIGTANWADVIGVAIQTKLSQVEVLSETLLRAHFDKPMDRNDLLVLSYYTFSAVSPGAATLYLQRATPPLDTYPTYVDLTISEMTDGKTYNLELSLSMKDKWGNPISDSFNDKDFDGIGESPTVSQVIALSENRAQVVFSEVMRDNADLRDPAKYSFDKGLTVVSVLEVEGANVTLVTSDQTPNELYTLTVLP